MDVHVCFVHVLSVAAKIEAERLAGHSNKAVLLKSPTGTHYACSLASPSHAYG